MTDSITLTALRVLNVLIWGGMAVFMARGAWAQATKREVRRGDPMRLACFATGIVVAGFCLRWLILPENDAVFVMLYLLAAAVGVYIVKLGRDYGRGPLL